LIFKGPGAVFQSRLWYRAGKLSINVKEVLALEHFRAKWVPVRVKKMRKTKKLGTFCELAFVESAPEHALVPVESPKREIT